MKTTILAALIALASLTVAGSASAGSTGAAPIRIHQPSAIEEGIGVAPAASPFAQPSPFTGMPTSAC